MAERERRRRWDAGTVNLSTRDVATLATIGDHLCVQQRDLGLLLARREPGGDRLAPARPDRAVRLWLERMHRAGLIQRERRIGITWVSLTPAGGQVAGVSYDPRRFSTWIAEHATTLLRLRLELEGAYPGATWRSERYWRRRRKDSGARMRVPDGSLLLPSGAHVAVEVERTPKAKSRYPRIAREYATDLDAAWWFATPDLLGWLERTWAEAPKPPRPRVEVYELPEGVAP